MAVSQFATIYFFVFFFVSSYLQVTLVDALPWKLFIRCVSFNI